MNCVQCTSTGPVPQGRLGYHEGMTSSSKPLNLDSLLKIRNWVNKQTGFHHDNSALINWLELDGNEQWKATFSRVLSRDIARSGTPADLRHLYDLGYDLAATCTHQVDGNALHSACQYGKTENALMLMTLGLRPEKRVYANGPSAIDEALMNGHFNLYRKLWRCSPPMVEQDRQLLLSAALSMKTRTPAQSRDGAKLRCLKVVLKEHGPFDPALLTEGLVVAARQGWRRTFDALVEAGADFQARTLLSRQHLHGEGNPLLDLFTQIPPAQWPSTLRHYAAHTQAFYPDPEVLTEPRYRLLDIDAIQQSRLAMQKSVASSEVEFELNAIRASRLESHLEETLTPVNVVKQRLRM